MTIDWAVVIATVAGPILAVWASEWRQRGRTLHDRKEWVFRTLWATRSANLHPAHVEALNNIDFAFPQKEFPKIADAWGLYFAHLCTPMGVTEEGRLRWLDTASNLLADLVHLMALELKIPFSKTQVKQPSYHPSGYAFTEAQQNEMRALALEVLKGARAIPIRPLPPEAPKA